MDIKRKVKLKIVPNLQNARASGYGIIFGKPLLDILSRDEIRAILAHELAHIKLAHVKRKSVKTQIFILTALFAMIVVLLALLYVSTSREPTSFTISTLFIGIITISIRFISWPGEYEADAIASQHVDKSAIQSGLLVISKVREMDINWSYYSHPSISNRIANLDWPQNVRHKKWYLSLD